MADTISERAVLACIAGPSDGWGLDEELSELEELARSAGADPVAAVLQRHRHYHSATLFGSGKVEELAAAVAASDADTVLCNRNLSPRQQLALEDALHCKVIDRTRLILDIFAARAQSREGRVQVELAQCLYLLPRLDGLGRELSRTGGGIGTRGPGETKLESDRRRVRARIAALRAQIAHLGTTRGLHRNARRRSSLPVVALVGYTNAGKSTLHQRLCTSDAHVADQMFATLDPSTRAAHLPDNRQALVVDTVGFVHDLPHALIAAFSATLDEVRQADLLVEVVDQSHPRQYEQRIAVAKVLSELKAETLPRILVWNKTDRPAAPDADLREAADVPQVRVSALTGDGIDALRSVIARVLDDPRRPVRVHLPLEAGELVAAVRAQGELTHLEYGADGIELEARCPAALASRLEAAAAEARGAPL